jgi:hypothetical protein
MTTRSTAQQQLERIPVLVLEVDVDRCSLSFGVAPCTATPSTGNECYNTFVTCPAVARASFVRSVVTKKFSSRGILVPGETVRPYIAGATAQTPTEIVPSKGLAMRSQTTVRLFDEPCPDHLEDPYSATRATAASGTFWTRLLARNPNLAGRPARMRQGYAPLQGATWDWTTFQTSLFVIDAVKGPDDSGSIQLVLSDPLKIADRNVLPPATSGALSADLAAVAATGFVVSSTAGTVVLATNASAVDSNYNGFEVAIISGLGAGQRRVVSSYVGATRTATLTANWAVQPDGTSVYEVVALSLNVGTSKGAQYADPATSGKAEYLRIGDEIVRYTVKSGDVLSWPDGTYRAQWGTTRADHKTGDGVQLCRAWVAKRVWEVLRDIYVESGIALSYLDTTGWQVEDTNWLNGAEITAIISTPEKASDLASSLLVDTNSVSWWDPVAQLVKLLANQPPLAAAPTLLTDDNFLTNSTKVERQDQDRLTQAALYYGLRSATSNLKEGKSYLAGAAYVDADAQSANEYGDTRAVTSMSRWLSQANNIFAIATIARRVSRLRNAPARLTANLDPKDEVQLGQLVNINTRRLTGADGAPKTTLCRVVKLVDRGTNFEAGLLTTGFKNTRYGVIAPAGQPDYTAASTAQRAYAYISTTTGALSKMSNGDEAYYIP